LKNALLTFKGVKNRLSWNYEAFNKGRVHVEKMDAKSKTLYLYLALDPTQFDDTKYGVVNVSAKRRYASTPTLIKIKGERKFKHALELIEKLCGEQMELNKVEAEKVDYRVARMTIDEMVDAGLMKQSAGYIILPTEEV
jgi:3-oxoacyl-[acyl-carrier-protein] synthase III